MSSDMGKFQAVMFGSLLLVLAGGCATGPAEAPAPAPAPPEAAPFVQVDDQHLVRVKGIKSAEFNSPDGSPGNTAYSITINDDGSFLRIEYADRTQANEAWKRVTRSLGATLHNQVSSPTTRPALSKASPTTQEDRHLSDVQPDDAYMHLTQQLGWLMKCVDAKLLTDGEYQQGRAWAIAELQANPQGNNIFVQGGGGIRGNAPEFEHLYRQLVNLARGKEAGLLNDDEAAKVRAAILKQAGLVE
jgi:hypothetical protein